jgi:hypothetical protein
MYPSNLTISTRGSAHSYCACRTKRSVFDSGPLDQDSPQQITDQTQYLHDRLLVLVDVVQELTIKIEVRGDKITRRERHPLRQRYVLETRRAEQFEEPDRITAGVLDIMRHGRRHIADIAGKRPIQRTGVISSRVILGGLHHHYARV